MLAALPGADRTGILGSEDSSLSSFSLSSCMAATEFSASLCLLILLAVRCGALLCGPAPRPIPARSSIVAEDLLSGTLGATESYKSEKDSCPSSLIAETEFSANLCLLIELAVLIGACLRGVKSMLAATPCEDRTGILGGEDSSLSSFSLSSLIAETEFSASLCLLKELAVLSGVVL